MRLPTEEGLVAPTKEEAREGSTPEIKKRKLAVKNASYFDQPVARNEIRFGLLLDSMLFQPHI